MNTNTTTSHSPLPFVDIGLATIQTQDGKVICTVERGPFQRSDAAYIVKACNNHGKLVEALEILTRVCERGREGHAEYTLAVEEARALLASLQS